MKFLRLDLTAFGPFTDRSMDLGPGFHLVAGRNEAGKSSTLRALTGLLFGIPQRTGDAHLHEMKDLRVGARIDGSGGAPFVLTRRKGTKNTLLDESGEPVPERTLAVLLGGVDADLFANVFALDHRRLRVGGRELVAGGGDLAESLFGAGLGRSVAEVLHRLEAEADEIFKPRASIPPLNRAIREYLEARKSARALTLKPGDWRERKQRFEEQVDRARVLAGEVRRLAEESRALDRQAKLIPLCRALAGKQKERADLGEVVTLDLDAATRRIETQRVLTEAGPRLARLDRDIADLVAEVKALVVPEDLLALDKEIGLLRDGLGAIRKATSDRDGRLRTELGAHRERAADALSRLGRGDEAAVPDLAAARSLGIEAARERRIRVLAGERKGLDEARRLLKKGHAELEARRARALEQAGREAKALGLPAPPDETLLRHENLLAKIEKERETLASEEARIAEDLDRIGRELGDIEAGDAPPSEDDLRSSRDLRAGTWARVRISWLEGDGAEEPRRLAGEFEQRVDDADRVADRMRTDADRVARRAALRELATAGEAARTALGRRRAEIEERAAAHRAEWGALWTSLGFAPLPPAEMRSWLRTVREHESRIAEIDERLAEAALTLEENEAGWKAWEASWKDEMTSLGLSGDATPEEAETVLECLESLAEELRGASKVEGRIAAIDRDEAGFVASVARVTGACAQDLAGVPAEAAVAELERRLREGTLHRERREGIETLLRTKRESRRDLEESRDVARSALDGLVAAARVSTPEELPAREAASALALKLDAEIENLAGRIGDLAPGADPVALGAELADVDEGSLPARIGEIREREHETALSLSEVEREVGGLRNEMDRLDGTSAAAEAAEKAEEHLAETRRLAESWAVLRLGAHVLSREVERYRKEHQGPLLARAGEIFARLTLGSFVRLEVDLEDRQLLCVRAGGARVRGEGLSEGTADQLYLALRVAAVEQHVAGNEPIPFVADDIFVNFDDDRARAGLEVLGELAGKTQVLFFTHHSRLRELAEEALGARCRVHELG